MSNAQIDAEGKSRRDMRRDLLVQRGNQIIATLHDYAQGGLHGHLFDADVDQCTLGMMDTFTLDRLLKMPRAAPGLCEVIFHRMDRRVDGRPRRIVFDEFWVALGTAEDGMHTEATSLLAKSLSRLLAVGIPAWRRQNRSGMFALQSISQMEGHRLTPLLLESCQTRFFFPNAKAMDAKVQRAYEGMDLHAEEIRRNIALAQPKREVYFTRPDGRRLVDLALHPIARSICGANRAEDHVLMDTLLARYGPEEFPVHWLQAQGFPEAAHTVDRGLQHSRAQARADLLTVAADD
jgi:type IV secretion system protein TrbE